MSHPVVHFEVLGQDAEALQRFYAELFGWTVNAGPPGYALVEAEEGGIGGGIGRVGDGEQPWVTFYVQVEDGDAHLRRAEELGGKTVVELHEVPGAGIKVAAFADPEGHVVGIVQPV